MLFLSFFDMPSKIDDQPYLRFIFISPKINGQLYLKSKLRLPFTGETNVAKLTSSNKYPRVPKHEEDKSLHFFRGGMGELGFAVRRRQILLFQCLIT